jgi:hypothetical protein
VRRGQRLVDPSEESRSTTSDNKTTVPVACRSASRHVRQRSNRRVRPATLVERFHETDHMLGFGHSGAPPKVASPESIASVGGYRFRARRRAAPRNDQHMIRTSRTLYWTVAVAMFPQAEGRRHLPSGATARLTTHLACRSIVPTYRERGCNWSALRSEERVTARRPESDKYDRIGRSRTAPPTSKRPAPVGRAAKRL